MEKIDMNKDELIEELFIALYNTDHWDDDNLDNKLYEWRKSRGEDAKASWEWCAREYNSGDCYDIAAPSHNQTREGVIEEAYRVLGKDVSIEIIEARDWNDMVTGEDWRPFASTRNHEIIKSNKGKINDN